MNSSKDSATHTSSSAEVADAVHSAREARLKLFDLLRALLRQFVKHYSFVDPNIAIPVFVPDVLRKQKTTNEEVDEKHEEIQLVCKKIHGEFDALRDMLAPGKGVWRTTLPQQSKSMIRLSSLLEDYAEIFKYTYGFNDSAYRYGGFMYSERCPEYAQRAKQEKKEAKDKVSQIAKKNVAA